MVEARVDFRPVSFAHIHFAGQKSLASAARPGLTRPPFGIWGRMEPRRRRNSPDFREFLLLPLAVPNDNDDYHPNDRDD